MNLLPKRLRKKLTFYTAGFTLVELLVVIGVLGILAAGLLATIDPLEQFRKGTDSNRKTTSIELINAITRYYASHQVFPWASASLGGAGCLTSPPTAVKLTALTSGTTGCLVVLRDEGELKASFLEATILKDLYLTEITSGGLKVAVCYDPESKAESKRAETKYNSQAVTIAGGSYFCSF